MNDMEEGIIDAPAGEPFGPGIGVMSTSPSTGKIFAALIKAQAMMGTAAKDSVNPHFKSSYADLASVRDAVHEPFAKNGLGCLQVPNVNGERVSVQTTIVHESGEWLSFELSLQPGSNTPQAVGSAITYGRRYSLMSIAGVAPEDDDGNAASTENGRRQQQEPRRQAPPPKKSDGHAARPSDSRTPDQRYESAQAAIKGAKDEGALLALSKDFNEAWHTYGWTEQQLTDLQGYVGLRMQDMKETSSA
jgi:ERF superfamily protein